MPGMPLRMAWAMMRLHPGRALCTAKKKKCSSDATKDVYLDLGRVGLCSATLTVVDVQARDEQLTMGIERSTKERNCMEMISHCA